MSEILDLAQQFKQKSNKTAALIETTLQDDLEKLHASFMKSLTESETIIKQGMTNLDTSNKQLTAMLTKHQTDMSTALQTYLSNIQAHTTEHLDQFAKDIETKIETYTQHIGQLIEQREDRIEKIIKSEMKKWAFITSFVAFIILLLGILIGAWVINTFSKPTYIIQKPQMQQPINYGQK